MDTETYEIRRGAIVYKSRPPLDVRIVAYYLYFFGFLGLAIGLLIGIELAKPVNDTPWRVLLGTVVLASSSAQAIYTFCMSGVTVFCAWALMRRIKFAWWVTLVYHVYLMIDGIFLFSRYPVNTAIGIALGMAVIVWLWFRRELYGVHLAASSRRNK